MKIATCALVLAALALSPTALLAGDSSSSGNPTITITLNTSISGVGPSGQPIGSCVPTANSSC